MVMATSRSQRTDTLLLGARIAAFRRVEELDPVCSTLDPREEV
jgi:hypothetical protein